MTAVGLVLFVWALIWDRSRGRPRCPRCWYDLPGQWQPQTVCPECGYRSLAAGQLFKTRRRWRLALGALILILVGRGVVLQPASRGGRWHAWIPSTVLIAGLPWTDEMWPWEELDRRGQVNIPGMMWKRRAALWDWQWRFLTRRCAAALDATSVSSVKVAALRCVLESARNPAPAAPAVARRLQDADQKVRELAAWGIKAARHDWGPATGMLVDALRAAPDDTDKRSHSNRTLALQMLEKVQPLTPPGGGPPSPDDVVRDLSGAGTRELTAIHNRLGVFSRMLTWPYDGESGPLQVRRFDLELDGQPGVDCVVHIEDAHHVHGEMLFFLRRGDTWSCAGLVDVGNQTVRSPEPRSETAPDGRAWLVVRECSGSSGAGTSYQLVQDTWLSVDEYGVRLALQTSVEGHRKGRRPLGALPVEWELSSAAPKISITGSGLELEYTATIHATAAWPDGWPGSLAQMPLDPAAELFTREVVMRFRWDPVQGSLTPQPGIDPWIGQSGVSDALLGGPDEFLHAAAADLEPVARRPSAAQREWLDMYLNQCSPTPERERLLKLLGAPSP